MAKQNDEFEIDELAARAAKNQYQREWNKKHRDRIAEYQRRYWIRKAQQNMNDEREGAEHGEE